MVVVGCTASLSGPDQRGFELSATTKPAPLRLPDEHAELAFGDFSLTGKLECSGGAHEPMDWGFRVALRRKGPAAIHGALIGALDLGNRRGKRPLSFTSYFFFDGPTTFVSPNEETMSITRLDYRCEIEVL